MFIIQGGAGTGKTVFVNCLSSGLKSSRRNVLCVASSALAASLIKGGKTAHAALSIPVPVTENSCCRWEPSARRHMRQHEVVIWDEMSMIHHEVADCVDFSFQDLHSNCAPFGGKVVVFVGDFKQLPPVIKNGKGEYATLRKCSWWSQARKVQFTKNFRALNNETFINELEDVGNGGVAEVTVPAPSLCDSKDVMIQRVFNGDVLNSDDCMILTLKVQDASDINHIIINALPGDYLEAIASDELPVDSHILPEMVASMAIGGKIQCLCELM